MSRDSCILTTKDFTILEVMLDRSLGRDDPMAVLLARKINSAQVVFRDDVSPDVATVSSRVVFSVDGRDPDTRVISHDRMTSPIGLFLPITAYRGLALVGLCEGQEFSLPGQDGKQEIVRLEKVLYQPEAARREKVALDRAAVLTPRKTALRLIRGAYYAQPEVCAVEPEWFDDPAAPLPREG
ncbi:nucleoside-diphosphate kinase [Mesorhizobium sp. INR15]|uniref:nucleoside-diphosphate kinase n=1 Tax=Mesorhizobium sp. INR15 TaxID=2654248 RepID=UPI0018964EFF|nr:nucleoside-diphosphate kinase [Mesorhizobium sp. INR15]QPC92977.1 nucleoside-diphosphate kinase [Mesorhizobium sp. INR15]